MKKHVSVWILALACFTCLTSIAQNVGIGTTSPVSKLNIVGNANNPAIPDSTSTGIFRIGVSTIEGIDLGKIASGSFAGWIQAGYNGTAADPLALQPVGGNVVIWTTTPAQLLDVNGTIKTINFQIATGVGANKILQSDAGGNAS